MPNARDAEMQQRLLELKSVQLELFSLTYRNLHAALGAWQDQVRFLDPWLQGPRVVTTAHGQVYSQNNEDGINAEIFRRIGTEAAIRTHFANEIAKGQLEFIETMVTRENSRGLATLPFLPDAGPVVRHVLRGWLPACLRRRIPATDHRGRAGSR
jgi:hypothetical protein